MSHRELLLVIPKEAFSWKKNTYYYCYSTKKNWTVLLATRTTEDRRSKTQSYNLSKRWVPQCTRAPCTDSDVIHISWLTAFEKVSLLQSPLEQKLLSHIYLQSVNPKKVFSCLKIMVFFYPPCSKVPCLFSWKKKNWFLRKSICYSLQFVTGWQPGLVLIFMFSHVAIWPRIVTLQILGTPMYPSAMYSGWRHETFLLFG